MKTMYAYLLHKLKENVKSDTIPGDTKADVLRSIIRLEALLSNPS
jgi:hypothetical protein